jgi:hypothetical protein
VKRMRFQEWMIMTLSGRGGGVVALSCRVEANEAEQECKGPGVTPPSAPRLTPGGN